MNNAPTQSLAREKAQLRALCLTRRNSIDSKTRQRHAVAICARAKRYLQTIENIKHIEIAGYQAIDSEVDIQPLLLNLHAQGARLSLPIVQSRDTLIFRRYNPADALTDAGFGTRGPSPDRPHIIPQIVLVPLIGFDNTGARLGHGKGHYDRALSALKQQGRPLITIGMAFSRQQLDHIPSEAHDHTLNAIITENDTFEVKS